MALLRYDGFVKSALGRAIAGASVWACNQPANIAFLPPSPLVQVYADVNGLSSITQPLLADGFGHFFFYLSNQTFTLVVANQGKIQQVYQDQAPMGAGSGGGGGSGSASVLQSFSTNGTIGFIGTADTFIKATGGLLGITLTLPSAVGLGGQKATILMVDASAGGITINTTAGQNINDFFVYGLTNQWQVVTL